MSTPLEGLELQDLILERNQRTAEKQAIGNRLQELTKEICARIGVKEEGSVSETVETPMGAYRLTTIAKLNRKVDASAWRELESEIPEEWRSLVVQKPHLDLRRFRHCVEFAPDVALKVEKALTTSSATPTLKIEEVAE